MNIAIIIKKTPPRYSVPARLSYDFADVNGSRIRINTNQIPENCKQCMMAKQKQKEENLKHFETKSGMTSLV